jgi:hypothetical protein
MPSGNITARKRIEQYIDALPSQRKFTASCLVKITNRSVTSNGLLLREWEPEKIVHKKEHGKTVWVRV